MIAAAGAAATAASVAASAAEAAFGGATMGGRAMSCAPTASTTNAAGAVTTGAAAAAAAVAATAAAGAAAVAEAAVAGVARTRAERLPRVLVTAAQKQLCARLVAECLLVRFTAMQKRVLRSELNHLAPEDARPPSDSEVIAMMRAAREGVAVIGVDDDFSAAAAAVDVPLLAARLEYAAGSRCNWEAITLQLAFLEEVVRYPELKQSVLLPDSTQYDALARELEALNPTSEYTITRGDIRFAWTVSCSRRNTEGAVQMISQPPPDAEQVHRVAAALAVVVAAAAAVAAAEGARGRSGARLPRFQATAAQNKLIVRLVAVWQTERLTAMQKRIIGVQLAQLCSEAVRSPSNHDVSVMLKATRVDAARNGRDAADHDEPDANTDADPFLASAAAVDVPLLMAHLEYAGGTRCIWEAITLQLAFLEEVVRHSDLKHSVELPVRKQYDALARILEALNQTNPTNPYTITTGDMQHAWRVACGRKAGSSIQVRVGRSEALQVDTREVKIAVLVFNSQQVPDGSGGARKGGAAWHGNAEPRNAMLDAIDAVRTATPDLAMDRTDAGIISFLEAVWEQVDKDIMDTYRLTRTTGSVVHFVKTTHLMNDCLDDTVDLVFVHDNIESP